MVEAAGVAYEHMQAQPSPEFVRKNREVQRLLGRCLLRIQHLERLLKAVVSAQHHYGTGADSAELAKQRAAQVAKLGMGDLVDLVLAEVIHVKTGEVDRDGQEAEKPVRKVSGLLQAKAAALAKRHDKAMAKAHSQRRTWLSTRVTMSATPEAAKAISTRLTALVQLRNRVVHHFGDEYRIHDELGCDRAIRFLEEVDAMLVEHAEPVSEWALELDGAIKALARKLSDPEFLDEMAGPGDSEAGAP